jgi:uncharacterized protein YyaL (SSP411 family)
MNLLGKEQSPYLLQHRDNPVHWMAWGEDAFARAQSDDKPVLLSVGYAACHWCHVMAHESFDDPETAALMNAHFINVKVDREERPDVDRLYMDALHALGQQGGWPLTMFLKPDGTPFWGGTYFPKDSRYGRPSFRYVLGEIARLWSSERDKIDSNAKAIFAALDRRVKSQAPASLTPETVGEAGRALLRAVDMTRGGLKGAPKFPQFPVFDLLWRLHLKTGERSFADAVAVTLANICQGGIYDHLGGGMARYSVDERWLVPHFEKMLYDNAQLISLLARVARTDKNPLFRVRLEETIAWLMRDMRTADGLFAASYDADSEGEEGRYYVWSASEVAAILPADRLGPFRSVYDVSEAGNWEGHNILNRLSRLSLGTREEEAVLSDCRQLLLIVRRRRVPPGFDDKALVDWNSLTIAALAEAALIFSRPDWLQHALQAFQGVLETHWRQGTLHHSWRDGRLRHLATAEGYANLIAAALALYAASGDQALIERAVRLTDAVVTDFWDDQAGGFYFASRNARDLIVRARFAHDDATPNANATMLANLSRLWLLTGRQRYRDLADATIGAFAASVAGNPFAHPSFLSAFDQYIDAVQAVLVGDPATPEISGLRQAVLELPAPLPLLFYARSPEELQPGHPAAGKPALGVATLYLCRGTRCALPVNCAADVRKAFDSLV